MAGITKTEELEIDEEEAELLSGAIVNMAAQYEIRIDPKVQAAIALVTAAGKVYGPRVVAIKIRLAKEKETRKGTAEVIRPDGTSAGTTPYASAEWPINTAPLQ